MNESANLPENLTVPQLSENALNVLHNRYLAKDEHGNCIEKPAELFWRVATLAAQAERKYGATAPEVKNWQQQYYELMASLKFLPNSPTLMNAQKKGSLSACFVLPIEDSIEGIFETIKQTALIQQSGGGTGFSFDKLRPTGDRVGSSGGTTSGPISFWRVFSETTNAIQQGAFRRGANMGMMSLDHPDILKFLHAKQNLKSFTNFNISVKITDSWMEKVLNKSDDLHIVSNPRTKQQYLIPKNVNIENYTLADLCTLSSYEESDSESKGDYYTVSDIWKLIIKCARKTGEPGMVFIDRINQDNPTPILGEIEATNPCGEQPLLPFEACTLGSINLTKFVKVTETSAHIDWSSLEQTVILAIRFLDNIIDESNYPVRDTLKLAQANRKIGLGVMGFADSLFMLEIPYDSEEGIEFGSAIMDFINKNAIKASSELSTIRGPFPNWNNSLWRTKYKQKVRNASLTCIAPTGTLSIIADCSAGIEPLYCPVFIRQILDGQKMLQVNPIFRQVAEKNGFWSAKLEQEILKTGSIQKFTTIPKEIRNIFKCAYDISPEYHIRMQAAFQEHCDAAVSKTINLSEKATAATIENAYKLAYQLGCKGITVYRKGSRKEEPMSLD